MINKMQNTIENQFRRQGIVFETIETCNESLFAPLGTELVLLKDIPMAIPTLADWLYNEWRQYDRSLTAERLLAAFTSRLNNTDVPLTLVVRRDQQAIGVVSLKFEDDTDFAAFADGNPWLGSLHVLPSERGRGLGSALLTAVQLLAKKLGYDKILLYTSNPRNVSWYLDRGAQHPQQHHVHGHAVTVMNLPQVE